MKALICLLLLALTVAASAQTAEPVSITTTVGTANGQPLVLDGTLTLPARANRNVPLLVFIAGSGPTDRDGNNPIPPGQPNSLRTDFSKQLADSLARRGVAMLRYDKRGSGTNLPQAANLISNATFRFEHYVSDAEAFIRLAQKDKRFGRIAVAGHSEGSLVGMMAARETGVRGGFVALAGAGRNLSEVIKEQLGRGQPADVQAGVGKMIDSLRAGQAVKNVPLPFYPLLRPEMQGVWINLFKYDPAVELKRYVGPVLIIQGLRDIQVKQTDAEGLKAARPDAQVAYFPEMNHPLKNAPADVVGNVATYSKPELPLTPGVAAVIATFVRKKE